MEVHMSSLVAAAVKSACRLRLSIHLNDYNTQNVGLISAFVRLCPLSVAQGVRRMACKNVVVRSVRNAIIGSDIIAIQLIILMGVTSIVQWFFLFYQ